MAVNGSFAITSVSVNNVVWTPYTIQNTCNQLILLNAGADWIKVRSDDGDANSEVLVGPGMQLEIGAPGVAPDGRLARFFKGVVASFLQSTTVDNTGPMKGLELL